QMGAREQQAEREETPDQGRGQHEEAGSAQTQPEAGGGHQLDVAAAQPIEGEQAEADHQGHHPDPQMQADGRKRQAQQQGRGKEAQDQQAGDPVGDLHRRQVLQPGDDDQGGKEGEQGELQDFHPSSLRRRSLRRRFRPPQKPRRKSKGPERFRSGPSLGSRAGGPYSISAATVSKVLGMLPPRAVTAAMITTAIRAAIRPYSMAVAPDSSDMNLEMNFFMVMVPFAEEEASYSTKGGAGSPLDPQNAPWLSPT